MGNVSLCPGQALRRSGRGCCLAMKGEHSLYYFLEKGVKKMIPVLLGKNKQSDKQISDIEKQLEVLVITDTSGTMNRTFTQINDAFKKQKPMFVKEGNNRYNVIGVEETGYYVICGNGSYKATSASAKPAKVVT